MKYEFCNIRNFQCSHQSLYQIMDAEITDPETAFRQYTVSTAYSFDK